LLEWQFGIIFNARHRLQDGRAFEQQGGHERDDQRGSQQIKGIAEGQDIGLLLYDMADGDHGALGGVGAIDHAAADEVLRQRLDPRTRRLFEQRYRLRQHV
jgi:hypothetical protein